MKYNALFVIFEKAAKFESGICCKLRYRWGFGLKSCMGENSGFPIIEAGNFKSYKLAVCLKNINNLKFK